MKKNINSPGYVELYFQGSLVSIAQMNTNKTSKSDIVESWRKRYGPKFMDPDVIIKTHIHKGDQVVEERADIYLKDI